MKLGGNMTGDEMQSLIEGLAYDCCTSLFEAYGVALTPVSTPVPMAESERTLTGVVGFTGPGILGMCLLSGTDGPLGASNPAGDGSIRDWIAELTNQLAGRLKHKLITRGAVVYITTPIVLQGARIEPLPRHRLLHQQFTAAGGVVSMWVEVETTPDFVLSDEAAEESGAVEGEALLFETTMPSSPPPG
jgi:hypothetical protein